MDSHDGGEDAIGTVILFLSFAVLAGCICKLILSQVLKNKFPAPFTVIVLIFGFSIGMIIAHIYGTSNDFLLGEKELREINPHLIYFIFLPLLIFDSAFNSRFHVIRPQIISAILLAGPGVLISIVIVAVFATYIFPYHWSWLVSIMFGSILSATDPVAVVALLHESGASKSLAALIDLESLLNDGSAFVIYMIFRDIVVGESDSAKKIIIDIVKFTIGGPAFGIVCGIIAVIVLNMVHNELEVEIISTFGLAYLIFYVADVELRVSAVLALVVMGLFMAKHKYCISSHVQLPMVNTWRIIIDFANILIFIITGIILAHSLIGTKATIITRDFGLSILLYIALHLGRLLSVIVLHPFIRWSGVRLSRKESMVLIWSGLRGTFHSTQTRMDNIRKQFPELANIDKRIWNKVYEETRFYHLTATYILLDLQQSYEACWRIHMTKRCAQMLLKYESKTLTELYETGMLGHRVHSHILEIIEKKSLKLEFYRVSMVKGHLKAIENPFDLLPLFRSLPNHEKIRWQTIMKVKHRWFQPDQILLEKGQRVSTAYLITRGIVECKKDTMPIYYRLGNIVGIDALFSQDFLAHDIYRVSGGLLEAYCIDGILLNQFLKDENLAPSIYREIALHVLSNNYQTRLKLNRLQLRLLVHKRAKFYWNESDISIQLNENQRLFILAGYVTHLFNGQHNKYESIQLQIFDTEAEILLNSSTVAYSWMDEDEEFSIKDTNLTVDFPLQTYDLLSNDLLSPGHLSQVTQSSERRRSTSFLDDGIHSSEV
ncbi:unnamed protein product [Rotaria sp. Silwood1]|nr:unnamed protein product [Rotaria sp. Silwood1]CAF4973237.1 unnamed protein product [Rotaria sp. Silwood1]